MQKRKITSVIIAVMMLVAVLVPQSIAFAESTSEPQNNNDVVQQDENQDPQQGDDKKTEEDNGEEAVDPLTLQEDEEGANGADEGEAADSSKDTSWYDAAKDSFTLKTEAELAGLAKLVNEGNTFEGKTVELANDITLTATWTPIGDRSNAFAGTFNGNGNKVSGLSISDITGGYKGLFGNNTGTIKNLAVSGSIGTEAAPVTFTPGNDGDNDNIGGVAGRNNGIVTRITGDVSVYVVNTSTQKTGNIYAVGGIVGFNDEQGNVNKCINNAHVSGTKVFGGVVGRNYNKVDRCVNKGRIQGTNGQKDGAGGIVGISGDKSCTYQTSVTNCYNLGTISNDNGRWHGGIVGMADATATVTNCYNIGAINKGYSWNWNPIIGHVDSYYSTVHDNYSLEGLAAGDSDASTMPNTIGTVKTESEFKSVDMIGLLGSAYTTDSENINNGYPILDWQGSSSKITEDITITKGGVYNVAEGMTGTITISTSDLVTLTGPGTDKELKKVSIQYTVPGANLRLSDIYINNVSGDQVNAINFQGTGNNLITAGTVIIEHQPGGYSAKAAIHVPADGDLTVSGDGTMYLYKSAAGAGIGGDNGETNGSITFNGGTYFVKGTKQSAAIGTGTNNSVKPGDITINGGNIYIIANSRGAAIGGAASSSGAVPGGDVYVNGGKVTINVDFSGAAIGGGGYDGGNDSNGGNLYVSGGSIKTFIDENAIGSFGVDKAGVHGNKAITAKKMNNSTDKKDALLLTFDTNDLNGKDAAAFTVKEGDSTIYSGGLHEYSFINEDKGKDEQQNVDKITQNWEKSTDSNLYLYLTKDAHTLTINDETFNVAYDADKDEFTYEWAGAEVIKLIDAIGTVDTSAECKAKIDKAQAAYNALKATDKKYVTNAKTLTDAANKYAALLVDEKIDAIGTVTLEKESQITEARAAYKALTYFQKQAVTKLKTLEEAEAALAALKADKAAADAVADKIAAIDDPVTLESKAGIDAARAAYDALTDSQKEMVGNYKKLTDAEKTYKELKAAAEKEEADKAAAKSVSDMIAKISDDVTLKDKDVVKDAEAAFDKLTGDQKKLVTDEDKTKLKAASDKIDELMQPVNDVIDMIEKLPVPVTDSEEDLYDVISTEEAYDQLSEDAKSVISDAYKDKLNAAAEKLIEINSTSGDVYAEGLDEYTRMVVMPVTKGDDFDAMDKYDTPKSLRAMYKIKFTRYAIEGRELMEETVLEFEEPVKLAIVNEAFRGYEKPLGVYQSLEVNDNTGEVAASEDYKKIDVALNENTAVTNIIGSGNIGIFAEQVEAVKPADTAKNGNSAKTGDPYNMIPVLLVMLAAAGAITITIRRKKEM